jgi:GNAT superfamily N-acetyltransferase
MQDYIVSDQRLAQRLESAEAIASVRFVEARQTVMPDSGAQWIKLAGAYAMYDGPRSPVTQTFGLGLFEVPESAGMDKLEAFFQDRGAPVFHEVSPLADKAVLKVLTERRYRPVEFTSVMFLPLRTRAPEQATPSQITVRRVPPEEQDLWARTVAEGWREFTEITDLLPELMCVVAAKKDALCFLAELEGQPIAGGALEVHDRVALLAGASTIPQWRHKGAQRALLEERLHYAASCGCDLAMICAEAGSSSQRNAERQGFRIAYTRIKWALSTLAAAQ